MLVEEIRGSVWDRSQYFPNAVKFGCLVTCGDYSRDENTQRLIKLMCWSQFIPILTDCRSCSHRLEPKKLSVSVAVPPAPVRVPSQRPLAPMSRQSHRSLMIRVIMILSWGPCTDPLAFALQPRKTPKKPQLGDRLMKGLCDQQIVI